MSCSNTGKTPYELRFEIFQLALGFANDEYSALRQKAEFLLEEGVSEEIVEKYITISPKYPTLAHIRDYASYINDFVSNVPNE